MTEESQQRKALRMAVEALKPFDRALEKAHNVISSGTPYSDQISHVVRATTYWLSYQDFDRLHDVITAAEKALGDKT